MGKRIDWGLEGKREAQRVWDKSGKTLADVAHDPGSEHAFKLEHGVAAWHAFRGGYRAELHVLNLQCELTNNKRPTVAEELPWNTTEAAQ